MPVPSISPFKLLRSYQKDDFSYFFGREIETRQLYDVLMRSKFMMVYGASGTGKTSLIQCGLQSMYSPRDWLPILVRRRKDFSSAIFEAVEKSYIQRFTIYQKQQLSWYPDQVSPEPEKFDNIRDLLKALFMLSYVPIYLILDQFEEIFTIGSKEEEKEFFQALKDLNLFSEDLFCKIIIITREEYIAHFYQYEKELPFLFDFRFRVEKMRKKQLLDVVEGTLLTPYENYPEFKLEEVAAEQILYNLTDEKGEVDLTTLQVYLDKLYQEDLIRKGKRDFIFIDNQLVGKNVLKDVLSDFLDYQTQKVSTKLISDKKLASNTETNIPLEVLFQMVTQEGTKMHRNAVEIYDELKLGKYDITLTDVQNCLDEFSSQESRILNRLVFAKTESERFEIMHDRLAERIFSKFNVDELQRREAKTTIQHKINRFSEAQTTTEKNLEYLSIGEIELIDQSLNTQKLEPELLSFFTSSRVYHQERRKKQRNRTRLAMGAALVFLAVAIFAFLASERAQKAENEAVRQSIESEAIALSAKSLGTAHVDPTNSLNLALAGYKRAPVQEVNTTLFSITSDQSHQFYTSKWKGEAKINCGIFSQDGQHILTGNVKGVAKLWDLHGKPIQSFEGHEGPIWSLAFSPDGRQILTGGGDSTARLWNLGKHTERIFRGHTGKIQALAFSPKGNSFASASSDSSMILWDINGEVLARFIGHKDAVNSVSFSQDGNRLLTTSDDSTAIIWNLAGNIVKQIRSVSSETSCGETSKSRISSAIFHKTLDNQILMGNYNGELSLWDTLGNVTHTFYSEAEGHTEDVLALAFASDNQGVLSIGRDKKTKLWGWDRFVAEDFNLNGGDFFSAAFSPDANKLMTLDAEGIIYLWNLEVYTAQFRKRNRGPIYDVDFSRDEKSVITVSADRKAKVWDLHGNLQNTYGGHKEGVFSVSTDPQGEFILTGSADSTFHLWKMHAKQPEIVRRHEGEVRVVNFSPDGEMILSAGKIGSLAYGIERGN